MWTQTQWYEAARQMAAAKPDYYRKWGEFYLLSYQRWMPEVPRPEIVRRLAAWNRERLDAVPDSIRYPELRGVKELIEAEWRGIRDGAGLSPDQWTAQCCGNSYYFRRMNLGAAPVGCSYAYFPTSDHGPILANNLDSTPEEPFGPPDWPLVNEFLILGGVSSGIFNDETSPEIFPAPVFKLVGRYCRTTAEAVELLTRYNHFWGPGNLMVIDHLNHTAMVEKSACRIGVRHSPDGFGIITAMTAEEPAMHAYVADRRAFSLKARGLPVECADTAYWRCADERRQLMNELLDENRRNPTLDGLQRLIQFRDPKRGLVCYNGETLIPGGPPCEITIRTIIWCLEEKRALWWAWENGKPSFENRKPDVTYSNVWSWK
ncbi:MAG: hypothetical protein A2498_11615 [Lentisphaerae bacterium RIFOXYC12_FULL_60_16]|nr:MAG: hypothetical protein A2498_11615 [Lentisphaerae bacterium RIFOXYC12_FULL_60_16]OGV85877.1 MAG: hypothetical protein A2340_11385 [Lentisphaerae bacterium RIFOXYB12_FULL_60_10]